MNDGSKDKRGHSCNDQIEIGVAVSIASENGREHPVEKRQTWTVGGIEMRLRTVHPWQRDCRKAAFEREVTASIFEDVDVGAARIRCDKGRGDEPENYEQEKSLPISRI